MSRSYSVINVLSKIDVKDLSKFSRHNDDESSGTSSHNMSDSDISSDDGSNNPNLMGLLRLEGHIDELERMEHIGEILDQLY